MRIVGQESDDIFRVKVSIPDNPNFELNTTHCVVAHDYVNIWSSMYISRDDGVKIPSFTGPNAWCSNVVKSYHNIQIPIRPFVEVLLPMWNGHKHCQIDHAKNYWTSEKGRVTYWHPETSEKMIAIPKKGGGHEVITYALYCELTGKENEQISKLAETTEAE